MTDFGWYGVHRTSARRRKTYLAYRYQNVGGAYVSTFLGKEQGKSTYFGSREEARAAAEADWTERKKKLGSKGVVRTTRQPPEAGVWFQIELTLDDPEMATMLSDALTEYLAQQPILLMVMPMVATRARAASSRGQPSAHTDVHVVRHRVLLRDLEDEEELREGVSDWVGDGIGVAFFGVYREVSGGSRGVVRTNRVPRVQGPPAEFLVDIALDDCKMRYEMGERLDEYLRAQPYVLRLWRRPAEEDGVRRKIKLTSADHESDLISAISDWVVSVGFIADYNVTYIPKIGSKGVVRTTRRPGGEERKDFLLEVFFDDRGFRAAVSRSLDELLAGVEMNLRVVNSMANRESVSRLINLRIEDCDALDVLVMNWMRTSRGISHFHLRENKGSR